MANRAAVGRMSRPACTTFRRSTSMRRSGNSSCEGASAFGRRNCAHLVGVTAAYGENDDRYLTLGTDAPDQLEAIDVRHGQIGKHKVGTTGQKRLEAHGTVRGGMDLIVAGGQLFGEHGANARVVVHDQNERTGHTAARSAIGASAAGRSRRAAAPPSGRFARVTSP